MGEFVRKSAFGYKPVPGGQYDPECSHVILTLEEYARLRQERDQAKEAQNAARELAEIEIRKTIDQGKAQLEQMKASLDAALEDIRQQLAVALEDAAHQRELNENLLRIARERANVDRGLRPKKRHSGFVVVSSSEREYRYKQGKEWRAVSAVGNSAANPVFGGVYRQAGP